MLDDPAAEVDREVQARLQALAEFLGKRKAKVSLTARPAIDTAEAHRTYIFLLRAATAGRQTAEEFARNAEIAGRLAQDDQRYFAWTMRANTASHRDWLAANETRHKMRWRWAEFFREWDLLLCPVASSAAFPHDHVGERHERMITVNGKRVPCVDQLFWAGYGGMAYLPATVAPIGFTPGGLPVGVQIIGPQYGDRTSIEFARLLEREFQSFVPPPDYR
jgi:amidase